MLRLFFILFFLIMLRPMAFSFELEKVKFISCYDGDTCTFKILDNNFPDYLNPMSIRVLGVDTPEMKGKNSDKEAAKKAKMFTINFITKATKLRLVNCNKDKYFRFDCDFLDNHTSLSKELIKNKLGVAYSGGNKEEAWNK